MGAARGQSSMQCFNSRAEMARELAGKWGEMPTGIGPSNLPDLMVEFWVNEETRTWSIVGMRPDGFTCIVGAGENWRPIERAKPEPDT